MRAMFVSRSSFEKPRPFERWVRTMSPSRWSTTKPRRSSSGSTLFAIVVLPAPERPVNQRTNPLTGRRSRVQPAFGPLRAGPAPFAALAWLRGVRVADRLVTLVMQLVVRQGAVADVRPAVVVAPVGERVGLPELVLLVPAELRGIGTQRRLVAADAGDPGVEIEQRAVERLDLGDREVEIGIRLPEPVLDRFARKRLDLRLVAGFDRTPEL